MPHQMPISKVEVLRAACCVAGIDQVISERELRILKRIAENAGVGAASLDAMIDRALEMPDFYKQQFKSIAADPDETMKSLLQVAMLDHVITGDERIMLAHFATALGMPPERFNKLLAAGHRAIERAQAAGKTPG